MRKIDLTSPVEIWGCELPRTDYAACSLTLFNLSAEQVTSVEVTLVLLDKEGEELARLIHRARSLNGAPGKTFAMSVPTEQLPGVVSWEATVDKVWYDNNSVWRRDKTPLTEYEPNDLPHSSQLTHLRMVVGEQAVGYPVQHDDLWLCVCGRPNDNLTYACARCCRTKDNVFAQCSKEAVEQALRRREEQLDAQGRAVREEASRLQLQREEQYRTRRRRRRVILGVLTTLAVLLGGAYAAVFHVIPEILYRQAEETFTAGDYPAAEETFLKLQDYRDSRTRVLDCRYSAAEELMARGGAENLRLARSAFSELGGHGDAADKTDECDYQIACLLMEGGERDDAAELFTSLEGYRDSHDKLVEIDYLNACDLLQAGELELAREAFVLLESYRDAPEKVQETWYLQAQRAMEAGDADSVLTLAAEIPGYSGVDALVQQAHYTRGRALLEAGKAAEAAEEFYLAGDYEDAKTLTNVCFYDLANLALKDKRYDEAAEQFSMILDYENSRELWCEATYAAAKKAIKDTEYQRALTLLETLPEDYEKVADLKCECVYQPACEAYDRKEYQAALDMFLQIPEYSDVQRQINRCRYKIAAALSEAGDLPGAIAMYELLGDYSDSAGKLKAARYKQAQTLMDQGTAESLAQAEALYALLDGYKESEVKLKQAQFAQAELVLASGDWAAARPMFEALGSYGQSATMIKACDYAQAAQLAGEGKLQEAADRFLALGSYSDAKVQAQAAYYALGAQEAKNGNTVEAAQYYEQAGAYQDAAAQAVALYDVYYGENAEAAQEAYNNGYYAMCVSILQKLDRTQLPAKYASLNDTYKEACYAEANRLYDAGQPYAALPYYREIPGYRDVNSRLNDVCYLMLGEWEDIYGAAYLFREDGTCVMNGEELFFTVAEGSLRTGESADALADTHRLAGVTKKNAWVYDKRSGTEVTIYLTKVK